MHLNPATSPRPSLIFSSSTPRSLPPWLPGHERNSSKWQARSAAGSYKATGMISSANENSTHLLPLTFRKFAALRCCQPQTITSPLVTFMSTLALHEAGSTPRKSGASSAAMQLM